MTALEAYILARAYTKRAIEGAGALKGAPCQIQSITPITGGNRITFAWETSEGETETDTLDVMDGTNGTDGTDGTDGVGISSITFKEKDASGNNVYTVTLSNTNTYDITCPIGPQGETGATGATGNGIVSITKTGTSGLVDTYTITYTNGQTSTFTVTNGEGNNEFLGTLEEWNALTTAQKKEYDTYQITNDFTGGSGLPNYSTTEQLTGQKWIDGKDIYQKTVEIDNPVSTGTTTSYAHGITNIDRVIKMEGFFSTSTSSILINSYSDGNYHNNVSAGSTNVTYEIIWGSASISKLTVTLYYTKTA